MGVGVYVTSQKVFFPKNRRGLGFLRHQVKMPVTNRFDKKMRNYIKQPQVKK